MVKIEKYKIYSFVVFVSILVTLTKTYVLLANLIGTSVGVITTLFFLINLFVIFKYIFLLKKRQGVLIFSIFIIFIPLFVSAINLQFSVNALFLQFFYFSQFIVGAIAIINFSSFLSKAIKIAIVINFIAGLFSMFNPQLFVSMASIINAGHFYGGRAVAFFLQPNSLGLATSIIYILYINICSSKSRSIMLPLIFLTTLLTGSRASIIILIILITINIAFNYQNFKKSFFKVINPTLKFIMVTAILIIIFFNTKYSDILFSDKNYSHLIERIEFFSKFDSDKISNDASLHHRYNFQKSYLKNIDHFILFGTGIGTQQEAKTAGLIKGSAHQAYLELLFQGGILYLLSYFTIILFLLNLYLKNKKQNKLKARFAFMLFSFVLIISFFSTGILSMRELFIAYGILLQYKYQ